MTIRINNHLTKCGLVRHPELVSGTHEKSIEILKQVQNDGISQIITVKHSDTQKF